MTNPVGRPLIFKKPEEIQKVIDEYFDWCDNRTMRIWDDKEKAEKLVLNPAPYTMSGLARRLGMDRRTLIDYKNRDEFLPTIKAARERVHEDVETRLMEKQATGAIFNLKNNFDWKDKTETEWKGELSFDDLTDEQLDKFINSKIGQGPVGGIVAGEGKKGKGRSA